VLPLTGTVADLMCKTILKHTLYLSYD